MDWQHPAAYGKFHMQPCVCQPIGNRENVQFICPYLALVNWAVISLTDLELSPDEEAKTLENKVFGSLYKFNEPK